MTIWKQVGMGCLALATALVACAPATGPGAGGAADQAQQPAGKKRIVAAFIKPDILTISALPPNSEGRHISNVVHAGLAREDDRGNLYPQLAETAPTIENGLWKVFPDGRMETTWKLKPNGKWHDGAPVTTADLLFGAKIEQDRELAFRSQSGAGTEAMEGIDASDASTVTIRWKQPYIEADRRFASADRLLPRHVLEQPYLEDRARFADHAYWTDGFIGAGPFKVKEYVRGGHILFEAFDDYILGRPKLDEIELRFIPDTSTLIANILAGAVDTTLGLSVAPDQAAQVRQQWREGQVVTNPAYGSSVATFPQMTDPGLPIVLNLDFRRAMLHAINRQEMVETIMLGQGDVAHTIVPPNLREHEGIQSALVRYDYDLRRAAQMLEQLGFRKGSDGLYEDGSGQKLSFEHWVIQEEQERVRAMFVVTDYWKTLGVDVRPYVVPPQQGADREQVAKFPVFMVRGVAGSYTSLRNYFHSAEIPRPENRFGGNNRGRYANPQLDAALDKFFSTIPFQERVQALGEAVRIETDQAVWMGLFYAVYNTMISNRLRNRPPDANGVKGFDAHLWDVTS